MNKEFIPYKEALKLKELGFDEPCFGTWNGETLDMSLQIPSDDYFTKAPTFSQAFRWFREKYRLHNYIYKNVSGVDFWGYYTWETGATSPYDSYEEAELACLRKLIEIVKEKL